MQALLTRKTATVQQYNPIHSYHPTQHTFKIVAINRHTKEDKLIEMTCNSDRLCNVITQFRRQHPGWTIEDSWEVA